MSQAAFGLEYPIGKPVVENGFEVSVVYLQPIDMEPAGMTHPATEADLHLEADIQAVSGNPNGFAEGDWMPYLQIHYRLVKSGETAEVVGRLIPMVASDGPHYGDNVKLPGPGKYHLTLNIAAPDAERTNPFGRHVDRETGVAPWFQPFEVGVDFVFAGVGKKGSY
jgi:uncharacterized protein involved in high-affinity Fe2+ transport